MRRYTYLLILLFAGWLSLCAQDGVKFVLQAPDAVVKGQRFLIKYVLEGADGEGFDVSEDIKGFDVLFGPVEATSTSILIINGKTTSSSSIEYTYTLLAKEEGTFLMPVASVKANGKSYKSNAATVRVLPPDKNAAQQPARGGQQPNIVNPTSTAEKIKADDVFVRAIFSKTKVNEQEAVVVTFRLYSALDIRRFIDAKFPEFEGFMVEEFDLSANRQIKVENYKGRNYYTLDVKQSLLFPQRSGKLTIPAGSVTLVLIVPSQVVQTYFGTQTIMADAEKTLQTSAVTVNVSQLPEGKPLGFSGGVGTLNLKSSISANKVKANEAVTLKLDITGTGNLKLIKNPTVDLPKDFELYDPKVNNNFRLTTNGLTGTRSIEYLFIPRHPGKYTIPELEFSYFDTSSRTYKTIKTPPYDLEVDKDPNAVSGQSATSYINQREVEVESDIRYLKTGNVKFRNYAEYFSGSTANILWYVIPLLLFIGSLIVYRKQIKANADIARMKTKKANKVATRRLKQANKYLKNNEKDKFYEESLRAVWGYLSDKLTISVADLNRENVEMELKSYGVEDRLIGEFISVLDTCEFARYAPSESGKAMDNLYAEMVKVIGEMENVIKIK